MEVFFPLPPFTTKIHIEASFEEMELFWKDLKKCTSSVFLLSEEVPSKLFEKQIIQHLEAQGILVTRLVIPGGEKIKSFHYLEKITDFMLENDVRRDSYFIALGGGALLDVGGFAASIYLRGIPFIAIPTTLLSMVDASLGGKTAINTLGGKNNLGSFHPASYILLALQTLSSLPKKEKQGALAEIIKYALILDKHLFSFLQKGKSLWDSEDPIFIKELIVRSLEAKKEVIQKDPKELHLRRILNFGHTIGHAIESLHQYSLSHGEAVIIGLLIESHLSYTLGFLAKAELDSLVSLLREYDLIKPIPPFSYSDLEPFLQKDKKNTGKSIRFVILSSIGKTNSCEGTYCQAVPKTTITESLAWYHALCEDLFLIKS